MGSKSGVSLEIARFYLLEDYLSNIYKTWKSEKESVFKNNLHLCLTTYVQLLEMVENPIAPKPKFVKLYTAIGYPFLYRPEPGLSLVQACEREGRKFSGVHEAKVEILREILTVLNNKKRLENPNIKSPWPVAFDVIQHSQLDAKLTDEMPSSGI